MLVWTSTNDTTWHAETPLVQLDLFAYGDCYVLHLTAQRQYVYPVPQGATLEAAQVWCTREYIAFVRLELARVVDAAPAPD